MRDDAGRACEADAPPPGVPRAVALRHPELSSQRICERWGRELNPPLSGERVRSQTRQPAARWV
jgi:hypothetical protein